MSEIIFWVLAPLLWIGTAALWRVVFVDISTGKADPILGALLMTVTGIVSLFGTLSTANAIWGQP